MRIKVEYMTINIYLSFRLFEALAALFLEFAHIILSQYTSMHIKVEYLYINMYFSLRLFETISALFLQFAHIIISLARRYNKTLSIYSLCHILFILQALQNVLIVDFKNVSLFLIITSKYNSHNLKRQLYYKSVATVFPVPGCTTAYF